MGYGFIPTDVNLSEQVDKDSIKYNGIQEELFSNAVVPVGGIIPFIKGIGGLTVPDDFAELNGQTINDSDSPLDGVTLPDLNGENRFLRSSNTAGNTGGQEENKHAVSVVVDDGFRADDRILIGRDGPRAGNVPNVNYQYIDINPQFDSSNEIERGEQDSPYNDSSAAVTSTEDNKPPFYEAVMIVRIK